MVPFKNLNVEDAVAFALRQVEDRLGWKYVLVAILTLITVCISMTLCPHG